jgi:hypothetical protein
MLLLWELLLNFNSLDNSRLQAQKSNEAGRLQEDVSGVSHCLGSSLL